MARKKAWNVKRAKKDLDVLWSQRIRERDTTCRKCRKAPSSQAAHIFGRGNLSTRWEIGNGLGMCYFCHIYWAHREPIEFTLWVKEEIGGRNFEELRRKSRRIYDSSNFRVDYERIKSEIQSNDPKFAKKYPPSRLPTQETRARKVNLTRKKRRGIIQA